MSKKLALIAAFLLINSGLFAEESKLSADLVKKETTIINQAADVSKEDFKENTNIEKEIEKYLKEQGYKRGLNPGDKYIITSIQTISVAPTDENFIFHKTIAYEKAYLNAQKDMLMSIYGTVAVQKALEYLEDQSSGIREEFIEEITRQNEVKGQLARIFDKLATLTEAKLDKALKEEGVDPSKLNSLDVKKKRDLFLDKFVKRSVKSIEARSLLGFFVLKSFYGVDKNGAPAIGIVAAKSPVSSTIARDIALMKSPTITKLDGKKAETLLPDRDVDFLPEMGVRLFFDETGRPALLSYGQSSFVYKGDNLSRKSKYMNAAFEKAKLQAETQIAEFLGTMVSAKEIEQKGEEDNTYLTNELNEVTRASEVVEKEIVKKIDILQKSAKSSAKAYMAGMSEIKTWSAKDENGHEVVGSVVLWSYDALSSAMKVQTGKDIKYSNPSQNKQDTKQDNYKNVKGSKDVTSKDDF